MEQVPEMRDTGPGGNLNIAYTFGVPVYVYVDAHTECRLTLLRARIARSVVPMSRESAAATIERGAQIM